MKNKNQEKEKKTMREPMVTRTITTTKVVALGMDIETCEPGNKVFMLPRTYKDEKAIMKELEKCTEENNFKCVKVVDTEVFETLYGMTEKEFIQLAKKLPSRTTAQESTETERA